MYIFIVAASYVYGGGSTIAYSGCFATSVYNSLKMSGVFGDMCPLGWFKMMTNSGFFSGALLMYGPFTNLKDKDGNSSVSLWKNNAQGTSMQQGYELALEATEAGAYVIININGHHFVSVVDVIDSQNALGSALIVSDVGNPNDDLCNGKHGTYVMYDDKDVVSDDYVAYAGNIVLSEVFAIVVDGHPFKRGMLGSTGKGSSGSNVDTSFSAASISGILEENSFADVTSLGETGFELPERSDILYLEGGYDKLHEIEEWRQSIDNKHEDNKFHYIRAAFMFIGILIAVYSVLLYVAFQFDRVNNFVDVSLLSLMTFGRLNVAPDDTGGNFASSANTEQMGGKYLKHKDIIFVSLMGIFIGVLLLSGKIFSIITLVKNWIDKLFS